MDITDIILLTRRLNDDELSHNEINRLFQQALDTENIDAIIAFVNRHPKLIKQLPKQSSNLQLQLYLNRLKYYLTKAKFGKLYDYDGQLTSDHPSSGIFYDYPKVDVNAFFKLKTVKKNLQYIQTLGQFERELITFYWQNYEHVIAIAENLDIVQSVLHRIFENAPESDIEMTVYRGIDIHDNTLPQINFTDITFLFSTSLDPDVANIFQEGPEEWCWYDKNGEEFEYLKQNSCCFMKIVLPKGTKFIVPTYQKTDLLKWQQEILLPPGGQLVFVHEYYDFRAVLNLDGEFTKMKKVLIKEFAYLPGHVDFSKKPFIDKKDKSYQRYENNKSIYISFLSQQITLEKMYKLLSNRPVKKKRRI